MTLQRSGVDSKPLDLHAQIGRKQREVRVYGFWPLCLVPTSEGTTSTHVAWPLFPLFGLDFSSDHEGGLDICKRTAGLAYTSIKSVHRTYLGPSFAFLNNKFLQLLHPLIYIPTSLTAPLYALHEFYSRLGRINEVFIPVVTAWGLVLLRLFIIEPWRESGLDGLVKSALAIPVLLLIITQILGFLVLFDLFRPNIPREACTELQTQEQTSKPVYQTPTQNARVYHQFS